MLGPYIEQWVKMEVEVCEPTHNGTLMKTLAHLRTHGVRVGLFALFNNTMLIFNDFQHIQVVYGKWLIEGCPSVILFDIGQKKH